MILTNMFGANCLTDACKKRREREREREKRRDEGEGGRPGQRDKTKKDKKQETWHDAARTCLVEARSCEHKRRKQRREPEPAPRGEKGEEEGERGEKDRTRKQRPQNPENPAAFSPQKHQNKASKQQTQLQEITRYKIRVHSPKRTEKTTLRKIEL